MASQNHINAWTQNKNITLSTIVYKKNPNHIKKYQKTTIWVFFFNLSVNFQDIKLVIQAAKAKIHQAKLASIKSHHILSTKIA